MNIRPIGLKWFRQNVSDSHPSNHGHVKVSKYYTTGESWTSSEVWWFDIPLDRIDRAAPDHIHLLCQKSVSSQDFFHLEVPNTILLHAINSGSVEVTPQSIIRLHLSARSADKFVDLRARGALKLDLSGFLR